MALGKYQTEFVNAMREAAGKICPEFGIPPQVCVAQSVLETGWGGANKQSSKGKTFHQFGESTGWNLWGIKGSGDAGSQNWVTKEYKGVKPNGQWITITTAFAKYSSLEAGVRAYCTLLSKDRYKLAKEKFSHDPGRYITYVWASGYATSPNYPDLIMSIMRTISTATGDKDYNVVPDSGLKAVIAKLGTVNFGSARISIRDTEVKTLFRAPPVPEPKVPPVEEDHAADIESISNRLVSDGQGIVVDVDGDGVPDMMMDYLDQVSVSDTGTSKIS